MATQIKKSKQEAMVNNHDARITDLENLLQQAIDEARAVTAETKKELIENRSLVFLDLLFYL